MNSMALSINRKIMSMRQELKMTLKKFSERQCRFTMHGSRDLEAHTFFTCGKDIPKSYLQNQVTTDKPMEQETVIASNSPALSISSSETIPLLDSSPIAQWSSYSRMIVSFEMFPAVILVYRLSYLAKDFENGLLNQLNEVKTLFNQIEAAVDQCSVDKKLFKIEKKELKLENERLLEHIISQDVVNIVIHADVKSVNVLPVQNTFLDHNIAI
ncbi:hypothetical protein Tco_0891511 [Tanacetum coccineum]|uniref:Uncharacterized protein n=1 Tax=Tanacetum coccineum TaxID=301880 RepID=A0ABQ5C4X0_9ASTR